MSDPVKKPDHYRWIPGIECKDVAAHFPFFLGCAIKYIWRAGRKNGETRLQALEKAHECLGLAIDAERGTVPRSVKWSELKIHFYDKEPKP
jgi:hypothetical protein